MQSTAACTQMQQNGSIAWGMLIHENQISNSIQRCTNWIPTSAQILVLYIRTQVLAQDLGLYVPCIMCQEHTRLSGTEKKENMKRQIGYKQPMPLFAYVCIVQAGFECAVIFNTLKKSIHGLQLFSPPPFVQFHRNALNIKIGVASFIRHIPKQMSQA